MGVLTEAEQAACWLLHTTEDAAADNKEETREEEGDDGVVVDDDITTTPTGGPDAKVGDAAAVFVGDSVLGYGTVFVAAGTQ